MTDVSRLLRSTTLRQLRTFEAVDRLGSFSAAARELHVTQPAVSMQVRELEQACGVALTERIGRRIRLTEAGRELAACAAGVLDLLRTTGERLGEMQGLRQGVLRLGAVSTAKYFAPALLSAFTREHPGIAVQFTVGNREEIVRRMAANETDLVIMGRAPPQPATVASAFAIHPLIFVAAPDHPLAGHRRIRLSRIARENLLLREAGSGTRAAMEALFAGAGVHFSASMEMSSNETIKQAVIAGMGIAFISAHTVGLELATGRLVALSVSGLPLRREWHVIHLESKRLSPVAARFRDFVLERGADIVATAMAPPPQARTPAAS